MIQIPLIAKILLRPVARGTDALLSQLAAQVQAGEKEQALLTINELKESVTTLRKFLE